MLTRPSVRLQAVRRALLSRRGPLYLCDMIILQRRTFKFYQCWNSAWRIAEHKCSEDERLVCYGGTCPLRTLIIQQRSLSQHAANGSENWHMQWTIDLTYGQDAADNSSVQRDGPG